MTSRSLFLPDPPPLSVHILHDDPLAGHSKCPKAVVAGANIEDDSPGRYSCLVHATLVPCVRTLVPRGLQRRSSSPYLVSRSAGRHEKPSFSPRFLSPSMHLLGSVKRNSSVVYSVHTHRLDTPTQPSVTRVAIPLEHVSAVQRSRPNITSSHHHSAARVRARDCSL